MDSLLSQLGDYLNGNQVFTVNTLAMYWHGLVNTVQLVFIALLIGLLLAVPFAIMLSSKKPWLKWPMWAFTYLFRATPLLIQLYIAYYGFAFMHPAPGSWLNTFSSNALYPALLAFTLNTAAYTTEIFRGAIKATPRGELEAARAYGMSRALMMRRIILPSAFRRALPAYGNEIIFMLHASAIASAVTIMDLTGAAYYVYSRFYTPFPAFIFVALLYMVLSFGIQGLFKVLERKLLVHQRPRG
ncbi:ABC transporter permease [Carnimonas bestiolae]|uniref:ABC transporter permease n=1 Tax=Carnimonas bestiolae TaxID=3402172 RepID=UPI003EDC8A63